MAEPRDPDLAAAAGEREDHETASASPARRALVTGVGGFVGQYLAAHLLEAGDVVVGLARGEVSWHVPGVIQHPAFTLVRVDMRSAPETEAAIAAARPDRIYQ